MVPALAALVLACPPVIPTVEEVFPANGASAMPANLSILFETNVRDGSLATMVVVTSAMGGFSGPATIGDGGVWIFDPDGDLDAGSWSAIVTVDDGVSDPVSRSIAFVVGAAADTTAPAGATFAPVLDVGSYVDAPPIDDCPDPPGVWAVTADWDDATDSGPIVYATRGLLRTASDATIAGEPEDTFTLEVFAYDAAGNVSAYPAVTEELPSEPVEGDPGGCGCTLAAEPARARTVPFVLAAIAAGAMSLRRRREP